MASLFIRSPHCSGLDQLKALADLHHIPLRDVGQLSEAGEPHFFSRQASVTVVQSF